jgi:hypothetical protein
MITVTTAVDPHAIETTGTVTEGRTPPFAALCRFTLSQRDHKMLSFLPWPCLVANGISLNRDCENIIGIWHGIGSADRQRAFPCPRHLQCSLASLFPLSFSPRAAQLAEDPFLETE